MLCHVVLRLTAFVYFLIFIPFLGKFEKFLIVCAQQSPHQRLASPHQAPGSARGPVSPAASAGAHPAAALAQQQAALRHQQAQQVHII